LQILAATRSSFPFWGTLKGMVTTYVIGFVLSLFAIIALFSVRYIETTTGRVFFSPVRRTLDVYARVLEQFGKRIVYAIEHIPALLLAAMYWLLHMFAVLVALSARSAEKWAHQLADSVSHKRNFEPRQTRSSFLRQVRHHKETLVVPKEILKDGQEF